MFTFISCFFLSLIYTEYKPKGDLTYEISAIPGRTGDNRVSSLGCDCDLVYFDRFKTLRTSHFKFYSRPSEECLTINQNQLTEIREC